MEIPYPLNLQHAPWSSGRSSGSDTSSGSATNARDRPCLTPSRSRGDRRMQRNRTEPRHQPARMHRLALASPHCGDRGFNTLRLLDVHILPLLSGWNPANQASIHPTERFSIARYTTAPWPRTSDLPRAALCARRRQRCLLTAQGSQPRFKRPNFSGQFREKARDLARRDTTFSHETLEDIGSLTIRQRAFLLRHGMLLHVRDGRL